MRRLKMTMFYMWLLVADISKVSSFEQSFDIEPEDKSVVVDKAATLPCKVSNLAGQLQWTKDDFALGTNRNLSYHGYPRYTMTGNDEMGEYNLKLDPVTLDDEGVYQCQVGTGKRDEPAIRSKKATLTVLVPPDHPRILQGEIVYTTEDVPLELECVSEGGKPPAELTWTDGSGNPIVDGIKTYIEAMSIDPRRSLTKSVLTITPKMEHHNTTIRCHAHNKGSEHKKLHAKITMNVKYAPKIELVMIGSPKKLVEGMNIQFLCKTKANPADVVYKWFVNDQVVLSEESNEMWLMNISRRLHHSYVKCEAQNSVGKAEVQQRLSMLYKPIFRNKPESLQAEPGSTVKLSCDVDSNPPPTVEWTNEKTKKVVSTSSNLTLYSVGPKNAGVYHCKTTTQGFGELHAEVSVILRTAPVIESPAVQFSYLFMPAHLECFARSVPPPERMIWSFQGNVIGTPYDSSHYTVVEDLIENGMRSTLTVKNIREDQFGYYNCTASNYYGSDSMMIKLIKKYDLMMLVAVVCASSGMVVIFIIMMIAKLMHNRNKNAIKKADLGAESDCTDNKQNAAAIRDSDVSSNVSDIKVETGTGSSLSNYPYNGDNDSTTGGPDSTTAAADGDNHHRSASPRSEHGLPLAGPVQLDHSRLTPGQPEHRPISMIHHPLAENDYANPMNYVVYNNNITDRPISSSNGYIAADRLYDLNPMPQSSLMTTSLVGPPVSLTNGISAATRTSGGDPATTLQYSAAYRNPYLRQSSSAQWLGHNQRQPYDGRPDPPPYGAIRTARNSTGAAATAAVPTAGPNYHIGMAKRQTLATHV
ncbi:Hypothetical protein CINCED_3A013482 [Cinara cedri]|uniref:Ig-like domain-containing protein n=1 Tax=Cinara cedri TaxID=506608 RepID=A0A5E4N2R8_9HEMI|nr:Hypothetical protein CINCED_3A013482 [Cinara cedri]